MKTKFFTTVFFLTLLYNFSFSQNQAYTKEDRNSIYNEYLSLLSEYKNVTNEQKESIALCCLEEVTKKYSKDDLKTKIDIEIKRIQQAIITQCAKNIGVDLDNKEALKLQKNEVKEQDSKNSSFKKEDFEGKWSSEEGIFIFYTVDNEFKRTQPQRDNEARGKWYLDGNILILEDTKTFLKWGSGKYQVVSVNKNEIVLINTYTAKICNLKRNQ